MIQKGTFYILLINAFLMSCAQKGKSGDDELLKGLKAYDISDETKIYFVTAEETPGKQPAIADYNVEVLSIDAFEKKAKEAGYLVVPKDEAGDQIVNAHSAYLNYKFETTGLMFYELSAFSSQSFMDINYNFQGVKPDFIFFDENALSDYTGVGKALRFTNDFPFTIRSTPKELGLNKRGAVFVDLKYTTPQEAAEPGKFLLVCCVKTKEYKAPIYYKATIVQTKQGNAGYQYLFEIPAITASDDEFSLYIWNVDQSSDIHITSIQVQQNAAPTSIANLKGAITWNSYCDFNLLKSSKWLKHDDKISRDPTTNTFYNTILADRYAAFVTAEEIFDLGISASSKFYVELDTKNIDKDEKPLVSVAFHNTDGSKAFEQLLPLESDQKNNEWNHQLLNFDIPEHQIDVHGRMVFTILNKDKSEFDVKAVNLSVAKSNRVP